MAQTQVSDITYQATGRLGQQPLYGHINITYLAVCKTAVQLYIAKSKRKLEERSKCLRACVPLLSLDAIFLL